MFLAACDLQQLYNCCFQELPEIVLQQQRAHMLMTLKQSSVYCLYDSSVVFSVAVFGLLTIGLSCIASVFTKQLIQASSTIWGVIDGPVAGIFIMGFFLPFVNSAVSIRLNALNSFN
jgi:hypothetical protein